jgi:dTDP-4-dehydrorhamnose reductase
MTSMNILVTGARGMLGQDLVPYLEQQGHRVLAADLKELDITKSEAVQAFFTAHRPQVVIHGAAYTAVDRAESDAATAYLVNGYGTQNVAVACKAIDAAMVYISTDYVFNGTQPHPYLPKDPTAPLGVYGRSKLMGEWAVQDILERYFIVRTSWLYGKHGKNFVDTMIHLAQTQAELKVVADQKGSPTWTMTLARALEQLIQTDQYGIHHCSDEGTCTWFDFAEEILRQKGLTTPVHPVTTEEFKRPAPRPQYSLLDKSSLHNLGIPLADWRESLSQYLAEAKPCVD